MRSREGYGVAVLHGIAPHNLSVYFVKWSGVGVARVPDRIDDLRGVDVVLAPGTAHDGLDGTPADAGLELLSQRPIAAGEGLASPATLTAEH